MDAVSEYKERRKSRLGAKAIEKYKARRDARLNGRMDDDENNEPNSKKSGGHGNTKLPFGLCKREGIDIDPKWTPRDAWSALEGKGYSASEVYKGLKTKGKAEAKPPKISKEAYNKAVNDYDKRTAEYNKAEKAKTRAERAFTKAIGEESQTAAYLNAWEEYRQRAVTEADKKRAEDGVKKATENHDAAQKKFEQAKAKKEAADKRFSEAESGYEDIKTAYQKAVRESPEYEKAKESAEYEERISLLEAEAQSKEKSIKSTQEAIKRSQDWADEYEKRAGAESDEYWKSLYEKRANESKERAKQHEARLKELEKEAQPFRDAIQSYRKKIDDIKGDSDESAWNRARDMESEDRVVKEGEYTNTTLKDYSRRLKSNGVKYESVKKYASTPSEKGIIQFLGGGDETKGSCVSLSFAFIANKAGYRVLDFRGGKSQDTFSSIDRNVLKSFGGEQLKGKTDVEAAKNVIEKLEDGKEYMCVFGRHAAIVRKNEGKCQYLELQSHGTNGWFDLTERAIVSRFACRQSVRRSYWSGLAIDGQGTFIETEKLASQPDFIQFMGYINTASDKQKKGSSGGIK